jgi:hypothetical protein
MFGLVHFLIIFFRVAAKNVRYAMCVNVCELYVEVRELRGKIGARRADSARLELG